jgi:lysophospholipase L1-like esterase
MVFKKKNKNSLVLGIILVCLGVLLNKWIIEATIVPDKIVESFFKNILIVIFQIIFITSGIFILIKQPNIKFPSRANIIVSVLSIFFTFLLLEISARVWLRYFATKEQCNTYVLFADIKNKNYLWTPHHYLNYLPTSNLKRGKTLHNSLGYRDKEFSKNKPGNTFRIVVLGDSCVYCTEIEDNEKTFTAQLGRMLKKTYVHENVEVINAGVAGYSSWEMLINLEFRVLDIKPDLLIIYIGPNDARSRFVIPSAYQGDNSGYRKQWAIPNIWFWEHSCLLRIISRRIGITHQVGLDTFINAAPTWDSEKHSLSELEEILRANPPVYLQRNLINIIAIAKENKIKIMLATLATSPHFNDYASAQEYQQCFKENNNVVKETANIYRIPLFDFANVMSKDRKYWADGRHVNEEGAILQAGLFSGFLQENKLIRR